MAQLLIRGEKNEKYEALISNGHNSLNLYNFDEADTIVMLGGCCCSDENIYATLMQINYILSKKRENAVTYLTGCITRGFKNVEEFKELEKNIKNQKVILPFN